MDKIKKQHIIPKSYIYAMDKRINFLVEKICSRYFNNNLPKKRPDFIKEISTEITKVIYENYKTVQGIANFVELDIINQNLYSAGEIVV